MTFTRVTLISHAATKASRAPAFPADEPVDPGGLVAARVAACGCPRFDRVLCGPEQRSRQTASALGLEPVVDKQLRDGDMGRWAGRSLNDLHQAEPDAIRAWLTDPDSAPHGGESITAILTRAGAWLSTLDTNENPTQRIGVVTQPAMIRAMVVTAINATSETFWRLDIASLSATTLQHQTVRWTLRSLNRPLNPSSAPHER